MRTEGWEAAIQVVLKYNSKKVGKMVNGWGGGGTGNQAHILRKAAALLGKVAPSHKEQTSQ